MKKPRIYLDTSVIGGVFDREFEGPTRGFFGRLLGEKAVVVISDVTMQELTEAPARVWLRLRGVIESIPAGQREMVEATEEMTELAEKYIRAGAVGEAYRRDALHIAVASAARVDVLVSWNFKHIVNLAKIKLYNSVNLAQGYPLLEIRSPREVFDEET
jgi:predicted nucleic acid-binding protein